MEKPINRRDFLKLAALGAGAMAVRPLPSWVRFQEDWPADQLLARNCVGGIIYLRPKPSASSEPSETLYEDAVLPWLREVVGEAPPGRRSRTWVETPQGYLYLPGVQPVRNLPNTPANDLPQTSIGRGMWMEVTVPYVDIFMDRAPSSPWLQEVPRPRLYYSQVMWVDDIATQSDGTVLYRVSEKYGSYGDIFWCDARAFRPITEDEIAPITPDVENKRIVVDITHQTLSCFEDKREVFFCKVSTGAKFNAEGLPVEKWSTPLGPHPIWRKLISLHMSGGASGAGWDTPGIGWTSLFVGEGVAIHSTFWHNDYGSPRSHGCVNVRAEDAKWIFRWTQPVVKYDPGDLTVQMPGGTIVDVIETA